MCQTARRPRAYIYKLEQHGLVTAQSTTSASRAEKQAIVRCLMQQDCCTPYGLLSVLYMKKLMSAWLIRLGGPVDSCATALPMSTDGKIELKSTAERIADIYFDRSLESREQKCASCLGARLQQPRLLVATTFSHKVEARGKVHGPCALWILILRGSPERRLLVLDALPHTSPDRNGADILPDCDHGPPSRALCDGMDCNGGEESAFRAKLYNLGKVASCRLRCMSGAIARRSVVRGSQRAYRNKGRDSWSISRRSRACALGIVPDDVRVAARGRCDAPDLTLATCP
ncbi:uncharacterized protein PHACADRAFT_29641 [Phanerochaete carnosa HHB-10118-sp]|uniref:Uncharacterized protein n=1 Tax=Phanerochaete carnosa (strain HHB-10118-sp) TaxID=650164 RepID=K5W650_PHACS|nr:uncharacterized protein PHACADRAFT_29641 [Phanerochaete carnosa HHB-10118-sp]EKM54424.1 hypothetical protein PHACADRAFT_29641 [Phanerochaete carnosa HHB-10118-sp]